MHSGRRTLFWGSYLAHDEERGIIPPRSQKNVSRNWNVFFMHKNQNAFGEANPFLGFVPGS
ncbi:hypothetical protein BZG02_13540 [Labilibaculum filiforme]|uniref:Uncharacterized protein n=1 Tax=Labilibaculum filiforme TaxID=1940526 RepID=A0A2N3HWA6_9BACT|nr:hypothetical protein BZG02_13540 [Labilibaculum filiforme]